MKMDGRGLASEVSYLGQERAARKLLLKDKIATAEEIAIMTDIEVYNKLLEQYEVVMTGSEKILIIAKENIQTFNDIAVYLSR